MKGLLFEQHFERIYKIFRIGVGKKVCKPHRRLVSHIIICTYSLQLYGKLTFPPKPSSTIFCNVKHKGQTLNMRVLLKVDKQYCLFVDYSYLCIKIVIMLPEIIKIKGVHPGAVLSRELKKRGWESKQFALSLGEHPQTINAISKGRRGMNPALSIKLGNALGTDAEYFMLLQAYYEIEREKKEQLKYQPKPDMSKIPAILFWDTDINQIDWQRQKKAVINRIFERGNETEIEEIISFYGKETIIEELKSIPQYLPTLTQNAERYLGLNYESKENI
jgi:addiction module HigA family antidote